MPHKSPLLGFFGAGFSSKSQEKSRAALRLFGGSFIRRGGLRTTVLQGFGICPRAIRPLHHVNNSIQLSSLQPEQLDD
jgi:hypothetical protein